MRALRGTDKDRVGDRLLAIFEATCPEFGRLIHVNGAIEDILDHAESITPARVRRIYTLERIVALFRAAADSVRVDPSGPPLMRWGELEENETGRSWILHDQAGNRLAGVWAEIAGEGYGPELPHGARIVSTQVAGRFKSRSIAKLAAELELAQPGSLAATEDSDANQA